MIQKEYRLDLVSNVRKLKMKNFYSPDSGSDLELPRYYRVTPELDSSSLGG